MIKIRNISKKYFGSNTALNDITLDIAKGEKIFLYGRQGSGKTTLLKTIAYLEDFESGTIIIGSNNIKDMKISDLDISFVFQDLALPRFATVRKVLQRPLKLRKIPIKERQERAREIAHKYNVEHLLDTPCLFLSNYDRVRVAIARAFVRDTKIILFDNPLASLDLVTRREFFPRLYEYISSSSATIIYATDNIEELGYSNNRVAFISYGRLLQCDRLNDMIMRPQHLPIAKELGDYNLIRLSRQDDKYTIASKTLDNIQAQEDIVLAILPDKIKLDDKGEIAIEIRYIDNKGYAYVYSEISEQLIKCVHNKKAKRINIDLQDILIYDAITERLIND